MPSRCISHRRINDGPSPVNSEDLRAGMARCSTISTGQSAASPIPMSLSITASRTMTKPVRSSQPGTLPCVRVISVAWGLTPAPALEAVVLEAELPVLVLEARLLRPPLPQFLARLPRGVRLLLKALVPVRLPREAEVLAVEELLLHRSFSAAT